jgi:type IV secretion system protein VirD4
MGHLSIIQRFMPVARDYKVGIWPILQDLCQLKELYKERWETIVGTAGLIQFFRAADLTTADWLSKRAGSATVVASAYQSGHGTSSAGTSTNGGLSYQQIERPNIATEAMFDMKDGHTLAWFTGQHKPFPVFAPMFSSWEHCAQRALPNPYFGK